MGADRSAAETSGSPTGSSKSAAAQSCNRVLVTGATGILGRQVMREFTEKKIWEIRGLALERANGTLVKCDVLDQAQVRAQFDEFKPNIVIHCAAERRPDKLEGNKEYATNINVEAARTVAKLCKLQGAWLVYMSTNYVFDGKDAPYNESASPNPLNTYGESKWAGEVATIQEFPDAAILRVPLLYGPLERLDESSVTALLTTIRGSSAPKLDNWQERFPTNSEDVAAVLAEFAGVYAKAGPKRTTSSFGGIFHWQANEPHTKYTMAKIIADIAKIDSASFVNVDDAPAPGAAPRPQFERMTCSRIEELLAIDKNSDVFRSDFRESVGRHLQSLGELK